MISKENVAHFEDLYRVQYPRVVKLLVAIGARREDAEDAAQDSFLAAIERIGQIQDLYAWVCTVARRRYLDTVRSSRGVRESVHSHRDLAAIEWSSVAASNRISMVEEAVVSQDFLRVALQELSPKARRMLLLRTVMGMRYDEIASVLGLPAAAVAKHMYLARIRLKEHMAAAEVRDGPRTSQPAPRARRSAKPKAAPWPPRTRTCARLPQQQRRVLELSDQGLTPTQIGEKLGISANAARVNLCHARKRLRPAAA